MPKLSVIIPAHNNEEHLHEALECLINQTEDDFEVIILNCKSSDKTADIIKEFCDEYVDFFSIDFDSENTYAAMNKGLELAKGDYVWFYAPDGRVNEDTVESFFEAVEQTKADVISGRLWYFGDFEPYYDIYADATAVLPRFDKYERSIIWADELSNKIYRRHSLTAKQLKMPEGFYEAGAIFNLKACLSSMKISGSPKFVYQRRQQRGQSGFSKELLPSFENVKAFLKKMEEVLAIIQDEIRKDTGGSDGDEAFIQEAIYHIIVILIERFYQKFWHLNQDTLSLINEAFQKYIKLLIPERIKRLKETYPHLALPYMVSSIEKAKSEPIFSLLLDLSSTENLKELIDSLYIQTFPFFELFVRKSQYESDDFPKDWQNAANLHVIDDVGFHSKARQESRSRVSINIRSSKPIDKNVLARVHQAPVPLFLKPYVFSQASQSLRMKRRLKERGLNIN